MKKRNLILALGMALVMTGCGAEKEMQESAAPIAAEEAGEERESDAVSEETEKGQPAEEAPVSETGAEAEATAEAGEGASVREAGDEPAEAGKDLTEIGSLLGMKDVETKDMFGGGEENWTEDRSFYVGRIFQAQAYGETYPVYTSCGMDGLVEAVSMRIVNGERPVAEDEVQTWTERISAEVGVADSGEEKYSEGGSRQKTWRKDGKIITLYYMEDSLTISFQNMVGELDSGAGRRDNFSVTSEEAADFAALLKEAVAGKNQEMLADLTAYPVYIGFPDGGVSVESREDFMALDAEKLFAEELTESVAQADASALSPSEAGFVLAEEGGKANLIFGLRNGKLAVSGINY